MSGCLFSRWDFVLALVVVRCAQHGQSGGNTAEEQQNNTGKYEGGFNVIRHKREEKHRQATKRKTDGGPHGYGSRPPERDTEQRRTKHRAKAKRYSIVGHNPVVIPALSQVYKLRVAAAARDSMEERIRFTCARDERHMEQTLPNTRITT